MSSSRRAFTLIEILVIIIIIAVMASVAVPAYNRLFVRQRFWSTVDDIQSFFAQARSMAMDLDTTVTVTFDASSQSFVAVTSQPGAATADSPVALQSADTRAQENATAAGDRTVLQLSPEFLVPTFHSGGEAQAPGLPPHNPMEVAFQGDGTADGLDMEVVSQSGYRAGLILLPATGRMVAEEQ